VQQGDQPHQCGSDPLHRAALPGLDDGRIIADPCAMAILAGR